MPSSPLPPLAEFLRWIAEMPAVFRGEPAFGSGSGVRVRAVVSDVMETALGERPDAGLLQPFSPASSSPADRNRLRWVLAACHLLWHPALRERSLSAAGITRFLVQDMSALAAVAPFESLVADEERREELLRRALDATALRLPGESANDAADRMTQVDSIERRKLLAEAAEKQKRSKKLAEEIRRKAAEEAASKPSGE
ncbi:MAG: hypothetical protein K8T20_04750 [Planctomycetes bacterium]|nr:hypothetical protein [Planctomycetota bacterium]